MPTYCDRAGIRVVPRTESVPDAVTPSALTVMVVKPARIGVTKPAASTVAMVGSALLQARAAPVTVAPELSLARAVIGVRAPIAVGVSAGRESAATLTGAVTGVAGGATTTGAGAAPEAGADAALNGAAVTVGSLAPPHPHKATAATKARRCNGIIAVSQEAKGLPMIPNQLRLRGYQSATTLPERSWPAAMARPRRGA